MQHRRVRLNGAGAVLLGTLLSPVLLIATYLSRPAVAIDTEVDLLAFARGFYSLETSDHGTHVWSRPHAELSVENLDRGVDWRFTGKVQVWRPAGVPLPKLRIAVDDVVGSDETIADNVRLDIPIPRGAVKDVKLTFDTTPGFVQDSRELGIAMGSMTIEPVGGLPMPPIRALAAGTVAMLALGAGLVLFGVPAMWTLVLVMVTAWSQAWAMTKGPAPYLRYPVQVAELAAWLGFGTVVVVWVVERIRGMPISGTARSVVALSLIASYLKLLVLLHPDMPIGDGMFHAHRFQYVLDERFYFTSLASGGYAFPYPILLYLVAAPFSFWTPDVTGDIALLRIIVTIADAAAGAMLYWMMMRATSDRLVAVTSVVWYHLVPMTAWIMTWGNLTNAFGQALFVASLAVVVGMPVEWTRRRSVAVLALVAAAAMLSHPSTCAILAMVLAVTALLYRWRGGPDLQPAAYGVAVAACLAAIMAFVLYYAWFPATYMNELGRNGIGTGPRPAAPVSAFGSKLTSVPELTAHYFGWPAIIVAAVGAWRIGREKAPLRLALAAAWGSRWAWRGRLPLRVVSAVALGAAAWVAIQQWIAMLP